MRKNISRRSFIELSLALLGGLTMRYTQAGSMMPKTLNNVDVTGNFHYIYGNPTYRNEFLNFLTNVFNIYPEDRLHSLIKATTQGFGNDRDIYQQLQNSMADIKPLLADLTYALPALTKQKKVMAAQTAELLPKRRFEGYLEIGSEGRYLDSLEEVLDIEGQSFFISERQPTYSVTDIIDRGQIFKPGSWFALNDYQPSIPRVISPGSLDLVTVYIGFHHCPPELREEFIGSIRDAMKPKGSLILRDHDAHNKKMWHLVALAHDVFNMGTLETWAYNDQERRHFYSLTQLDSMMKQFGFKSDGNRLLQNGDPTLNALMSYTLA